MRSIRIRPEAYRRITLAALVALGVIIVTGASVRLTESGMGCSTWPGCEPGSMTPRAESGLHGWIEFLNRLFTGVVSVAVILAVLGSLARVPRRRDLTLWAYGLVAGVLAQAILGGIVVLTHVTPVAVMGHYLLSAVLVWNAVVLHQRAGEPEGVRRPRADERLRQVGRAVMVAAGAVLVTGTVVTGTGPHGGDEAAERLPFAITTVVRIHGVTVWVFLVLSLVAWRLARRGGEPVVQQRLATLLTLIGAQALLGYTQYVAGVPELLVGAHVLGSVLVWIAAVRFHLSLTTVDARPGVGDGPPATDGPCPETTTEAQRKVVAPSPA